MTNILTKAIILKKVFEVRLLVISKIKKTILIIHNTKTRNVQSYTDLKDLPDSPNNYPKLDNKIDKILRDIGLEITDEEKYDLYRNYSDIVAGKTSNQLGSVVFNDELYEKISLLISQSDMNLVKPSTLGSVIKSFTTHYLYDEIEELISLDLIQKPCLVRVDFHELEEYLKLDGFDGFLYQRLREVRKSLEAHLNKDYRFKYPQVTFTGMEKNVALNYIGSEHIGQTVTFEGTITKLSKKFAVIKNAVFQCNGCMRLHSVEQNSLFLVEPGLCPECGGRQFTLLENECEYRDAYMMELEEIPELRRGNTAESIIARIEGLLVDPNNPLNLGDTITVTGVVNAKRNERTKKNEFNLDIYHYVNNKTSYKDIEVTPEDVELIEELSSDPEVITKLRDSILPFIHGHESIKRGLIIQLFSGELETKPQVRTGLNVLLIGDPGVAKSRMGKHIVDITPKSKYVEGTGTTVAGLVGDVSKDNVLGEGWTFTIGSILQANQGLLVMDEIDKVDKEIIVSLNECTSQGSVTINKAGQRGSFNTNTNVLAMGNPKYSSFREDKTIWEQCRVIDDTTLTRFHLIYAMHDEISSEHDLAIMSTMLDFDFNQDQIVSDELLNKYIAYAKTNCKPDFSPEAKSKLAHYYSAIRIESNKSHLGKPLTPRDGEALRNISMALARIRLSDTVTVDDTELAIEVYNEALKTVDLDINTAGAIRGVQSQADKEKDKAADDIVNECYRVMMDEYGVMESIPYQLKQEYSVALQLEMNWTKEEADEYLEREVKQLITLNNPKNNL